MKRFLAAFFSVVLIVLMLPFPTANAGTIIWPVPGHTAPSRGWQTNHYALDVHDDYIEGATIVASMGGTVYRKYTCPLNHYPSDEDELNNLSCKCYGFGNGIVIHGDDGRYYQYAHMLHGSIPSNVYYGARVEAGAMIGQVGNTGNSSGPHLHFAITTLQGNWKPPYAVDPAPESYIYNQTSLGYPTPLDTTFTAPIHFDAQWVPLESKGIGSSVELALETGYASQLWYFEWQTDGSYIIFTCLDGSCIEVAADNTICIASWTGSDAQRWFLHQRNGKYLLESKSRPGYVLEVPGSDASFGNVPIIAPYHGGTSQIWALYMGEDCVLHGPEISVEAGTSTTPTKFSWLHSYGASHYNLKIWKNEAWVGDPHTTEYTVTPGCSVMLPAGTYQAYVDACHYFSYDMSNLVTFTVEPGSCSHTYDEWHTTTAATCESAGSKTRTCNLCGNTETEAIPAIGHDWNTTITPANCQHTQQTRSVCRNCGNEILEEEPMEYSAWVETYPDTAIEGYIQTMTQYRYRDRLNTWSDPVQYTLDYAWPQDTEDWQGMNTASPFYAQYNNTPVPESESESEKVTVVSAEHIGYLYFHWCKGHTDGPYNRVISNCYETSYPYFHAFTSTEAGSDYDANGSYGQSAKYLYNNSCCTDSWWWRQIPIYRQTYTVQTKAQTTDGWGSWSDWSDGVVTASDTRQVETRTLYSYVTNLGEHSYTDSSKTTCSVCTHFREDDGEGTVAFYADYNRDNQITEADAVYLLWHNLFPGTYPIDLSGDTNGDGTENTYDAVYLLWYALDLL